MDVMYTLVKFFADGGSAAGLSQSLSPNANG